MGRRSVAQARIVPGLRVLLISDWYPDDATAFQGSFVRQQALAVARDHEVVVLHLRTRRPGEGTLRLEEENDPPLRVLRVRHSSPPAPATAVNLWAVAAVLRRLRRERRFPDVLHAHEFGAGFAAVVLGRLVRRPVIVSEHSSEFATGAIGGAAAWIARRGFAGADLVCPVSESLRASLEQGGWNGRYEVVPNVVDTERFIPGPALDVTAPPRVVVVASLRHVKGVEDLVEAVGLVARRRAGFSVDVVGDGPLLGALRERARTLGLDGRLAFHGALPRDGVAALMRGAAFAVVPSRWETFSVVLSEAMACGLPVLATAVGGMPERIHAGNGIVCPPRDPVALAAGLERMLDEHRRFDRAAIAAEVRAGLSPDALARRWTGIYREVSASRRRAGKS
jgi:glycosyltransferase involved in cell wall biosynthesis